MSYDTKCHELAEAFLADLPSLNNAERRHQLAQQIQETIEAEIAWMEREEAVKAGQAKSVSEQIKLAAARGVISNVIIPK